MKITENLKKGQLLLKSSKLLDCESLCQEILQEDKNNHGALHILYKIYDFWAATDKKQMVLDQLIALKPTHKNSFHYYYWALQNYMHTNNKKAFEDLYKKALGLFPENKHFFEALKLEQDINEDKDFKDCEKQIKEILQTPLNAGLISKLLTLHGKLYEKRGEYDKAFDRFYIAGQNRLKNDAKGVAKDVGFFNGLYKEYCALYADEEGITSNDEVVEDSDPFAFICGYPRSGTSLTNKITSFSDHFHVTDEIDFFQLYLIELIKRGKKTFPNNFKNISIEELKYHRELLLSYINDYKVSLNIPDSKKLIIKLPQNSIHMGVLSVMFPNAKFIHLKRNKNDNIISAFSTYFSHGMIVAETNSLEMTINSYDKVAKLYEMQIHILGNKIFELRYEDLVNNFEDETIKLFKFLDEKIDKDIIQKNLKNNKFSTHSASYHQISKKIYSSSIGKWKNYENFFQEANIAA